MTKRMWAGLGAILALSACSTFSPMNCGNIDFRQTCKATTECVNEGLFGSFGPCNPGLCNSEGRCVAAGPLTEGTVLPDDPNTKGDCNRMVCRAGFPESAADPGDVPVSTDLCKVGKCDKDNPGFDARPDGTSCPADEKTAACVTGACQVLPVHLTPTSGGTGGSGGGGGAGGTGGADGGVDGSADGGVGIDSGTDAGTDSDGGACQTCSAALRSKDPPDLCPGKSAQLYDALASCVCVATCAGVCADNLCGQADLTQACIACLASATIGCGTQLIQCNADH